MSEETQQDDITGRQVVYTVPDMDAVTIRRDIEYQASEEGSLTMDLYLPPGSKSAERLPAVVLVSGYPDPGYEKALGCKQKDMDASVSWGQLTGALTRNLPVTLVNHASAPHAFDLMDDSETSREVIRQILAFLRFHLLLSDAST